MDRRLVTAKRLGVIALIILVVGIAALAFLLIGRQHGPISPEALNTVFNAAVFYWLLMTPVMLGLCTAGIVLSNKAARGGAENAGGARALCIGVLALTAVAFMGYGVIISSFM